MAKSKSLSFVLAIGIIFFVSSGWPLPSKALIPSDTYYREQVYLRAVHAEPAWDVGTGSSQVVIAVLDSGVQITHPDLVENIWNNSGEVENGQDDDHNGYVDDVHGWNFVDNVADPSPKITGDYRVPAIIHGTMVAGVAAATGSNALGVTGVCFRCKIMPLRVLDGQGRGDVASVIEAVDYAVRMRANVLNLSFVGVHGSPALGEALQRAWRAGLVIVAAAGNEGEGQTVDMDVTPQYPVCMESAENSIIGVAAVDENNKLAAFSNYGKRCVDIVAPGTKFVGLQPVFANEPNFRQAYGGWWAGTSLATAVVSGAAGLIKSTYPNLTNAEIRDRLLQHTDSLALQNPELYTKLGAGLLNIYSSLVPPHVEVATADTNYHYPGIVTAFSDKGKAYVRIFDHRGRLLRQFLAFDEPMDNASVAVGDLDGDGVTEIVVGVGRGAKPEVRIFNESGEVLGKWLAYQKNFRGGVAVAVGDVNGDGKDEIVTGAGSGGGPHVRVFDRAGTLVSQFFAYDSNFRGGVAVAVGDVNADGKDEIVTGAGSGGGPQVRVFNDRGLALSSFFAFPKDYKQGIRVAVGTFVNAGGGRIVVTPASAREPLVRIFDLRGQLGLQFRAYPTSWSGGLTVTTGDVDGNGTVEVIVAPGSGGSQVRVFTESGESLTQFFAFTPKYRGGVSVSSK